MYGAREIVEVDYQRLAWQLAGAGCDQFGWLKRQLSAGFQLVLSRLIRFRSPGFQSKSASFQSIGVSGPAGAEFWRGRYSLMG
ncbi:hypothetical protein WN943_001877 [Citrus x changshan-huyou]